MGFHQLSYCLCTIFGGAEGTKAYHCLIKFNPTAKMSSGRERISDDERAQMSLMI